jgi:hypothetical protein
VEDIIVSQAINIFKNTKIYFHGPINMEANVLFNRGVGEVMHHKIWKIIPRPQGDKGLILIWWEYSIRKIISFIRCYGR